jgi:hypothetical protein
MAGTNDDEYPCHARIIIAEPYCGKTVGAAFDAYPLWLPIRQERDTGEVGFLHRDLMRKAASRGDEPQSPWNISWKMSFLSARSSSRSNIAPLMATSRNRNDAAPSKGFAQVLR